MKHKVLKILTCISLVAMVLCAVTPGAFADETETSDDSGGAVDHKMGHGPCGAPDMDSDDMEAPVFDTEEEEMDFLVERANESISRQIEMLEEKLADTDDEDEEAEIEEQITELNELLEDIEDATTLDDIKEIMETARESMMTENPVKGERPDVKEMVFDSDDEEMEYLVERETEHITKRIEMLDEKLADTEDDDEEAEIEKQITELDELLEDIDSVDSLDELKEILEEYRENNPRPEGYGGEHRPMGPAPELEEEVTEE
ncbi:hypothetical protein [Methanolobus vulcani]|uniref:Uncharacterized protein n=1 Tax=Methanolobus vulcani TaxID=38026 RepID=A0A7Z8KMQ5_9EURY|nr:hypothetical protein [Methanolobus vulcani]TQD24953.1 hypothetical protein FKV42_07745 [Methanolobus vulcani]